MKRSARALRSALPVAPSTGALGLLLTLLAGCSSPLYVDDQDDLRRSIIQTSTRELVSVDRYPQPRLPQRISRVDGLGLEPDILRQLEQSSGFASYEAKPITISSDLTGQPQEAVMISLQRAILTSVENNLEVQFARLGPAAAEAQRQAAEAAFDTVLFGNVQFQKIDRPQVQTSVIGITSVNTDTVSMASGVRRVLPTGAQVSLTQSYSNAYNDTPNSFTNPNPANTANLTAEISQPLLRNFGTDTNLAQVRIAENAELNAVAVVKANLLNIVAQVEQTYWSLVGNYYQLRIATRLLERGIETQFVLRRRKETVKDVSQSQIADAAATVERRRADVLRVERELRRTSDQLKQLMNDPNLTIGSEMLLLPVDTAVDAPLQFSLPDCIRTALANRPEIQRAILSIDDASIRQMVADNQRLPELNLQGQMVFNGLADDFGSSFSEEAQGRFVDYLVGLAFEQPIGNREAEAVFQQRRMERQQAMIAYRDVVQRVLLDVKAQLRDVETNYRLIEQNKAARIASAENLRALEVEEKTIRGLTPEFIDLKLRRQQELASAEVQELFALTEYNAKVAALYSAMGIALERNKIAFIAPDVYRQPGAPADIAPLYPAEHGDPIPQVPAPEGSPSGAAHAPAPAVSGQ